ncbi:MAG: hypothetical protein ACKOTH_04235, partial [Solirubrobacterales bacterium]
EAEIPGVTPSPEEQDRERRRREREAERQAGAGEDPDTVVEEYDEVDYEPEGEYADEEIEEVDIFSEDLPPRADDQDR